MKTGRGVVLIVSIGTLAACRDKQTPTLPAKRSALPDSAEQVIFGLRQELTTNGIRRGRLQSDTAFFYDQSKHIELRRVTTTFFDAAGAKSGAMTAERGFYDVNSQKIEGRGNVVVTSTDGKRLTSPHLIYQQTVNQISSDTAFTFTEPGRELTGVGFRSDPQLHNVQVLRNFGGHTVLPAGGLRSGAKP